MKNRNKIKLALLVAGDASMLYLSLVLALFLRRGELDLVTLATHLAPFTINFAAWLVFFGAFGLYEFRAMKNTRHFLLKLIQSVFFNILISSFIFYFFTIFGIEPKRNLITIAAISTILIFAWRYLFNLIIIKTTLAKVLFLGKNQEIARLTDYLSQNPQLGHKAVGFIEYGTDLKKIVAGTKANTIVITSEIKENKTLVKALFQVMPLGIAVIEFNHYYEMLTGKIPLSLIEEVWFLENLMGIKKQFYEFFKRLLDIALAIIASIITIALFPCIALGMILSTPRDIILYVQKRARDGDGIIFFHQKRVGKNGKIFNFVKFRSQKLGAERMSDFKEIAHDPRQYPFGIFLRKYYLDELPQIWNILKGEMSFIGPRPERPEYVEELQKTTPFYEMRLLVLPGITGWAQINMENDADVKDAPEKMQYDLYYIKNRSFVLDLLIAFRTLFTILRRQGR